MTPVSVRFFFQQCRVFNFKKLLLNVRFLSVNGIFDDVSYDVIST